LEITTLLALGSLGGLTGLDAVSFAQTMIARPVVAGPLAGLIIGDPVSGMWAGAVLEVLTLNQLPVGAARTWDTGPAAVIAAVTLTRVAGGLVGLVLAVGLGVLVGWVGGWSVHALRHFNARFVAIDEAAIPPRRLAGGHLAAMAFDFARAVALTLVALALVSSLEELGRPGPDARWAAGALLLASVSLALGADARVMVGSRRLLGLFAAAMGLSAALTLWLG
jgi:mannose/fructose/N-acetylgalactosamine-specific phosphotransferase system component IIC